MYMNIYKNRDRGLYASCDLLVGVATETKRNETKRGSGTRK
jgi:hypothetical protein